MPTDTPSRFLGSHHRVATNLENVIVLTAPFDADQFHPKLFKLYKISEPDTIQASVPKRRASFLAGRALTAQVFAKHNVSATPIAISPSRAPQWPSGIAGSISHTHGYCASIVAVGDDYTVGIDIETIISPHSMPAVLKRVITDAEKTWINQNHPTADAVFYTTLFSAKETIYKALFPITQTFFGFDAAEIHATPADTSIQLRLTRELHKTLPKGLVLSINVERFENHILTWMAFPTQ
jgi:enterobactin synthetase component D